MCMYVTFLQTKTVTKSEISKQTKKEKFLKLSKVTSCRRTKEIDLQDNFKRTPYDRPKQPKKSTVWQP